MSMMRAVRQTAFDGPEVLRIAAAAVGTPAGEIVLTI